MRHTIQSCLMFVFILVLAGGCRAAPFLPDAASDSAMAEPSPSFAVEDPQPSPTRPSTSTSETDARCPPASGAPIPITPIESGNTVIEGFEPQIREFLDGGGSPKALEGELNVLTLEGTGETWLVKSQVMSVDLTGDEVPEVVLDLVFYVPGQYSDGGVFIYRCENGRYVGGDVTAISGVALPVEQADAGGIRALHDMDGDSLPEVVISSIEMMGTHANYTRVFEIYSWGGNGFVDISPRDSYGGSKLRVQNGDGEVVDQDEDGIFELVFSPGPGRGPESAPSQAPEREIWGWDGDAFVVLQTEELASSLQCAPILEPPVFRFQAFQFGDVATLCGEYEDAQAYYQQAVFDEELLGWSPGRCMDDSEYRATPTPDPDERSKINAYGRYRIVLLHVVREYISDAQVVYESLVEKYPEGSSGSAYTELASVFWDAYKQTEDLGLACEQAVEYATSHEERVLKPLSAAYYGVYGFDYAPEDICPFK
jgi:hypothetical protein